MLSCIVMDGSLFDKRLIYVTGKGGVGKTTVAASLGITAAAHGRRTIVCEVAEQDRVSRALLGGPVSGESEVLLDDRLWATSIDPRVALEEWLSGQLGAPTLVRTLMRASVFQYFVAAAPGAKELITVGRIWDLAQPERWNRRNRTYDLVVVDAPASGHGVGMLKTPQTFGDIARVGPVRRQAAKIRDLLGDPARTAYVGVALPEEMPVTETIELDGRLRATVGPGLDAVVVNAVTGARFAREEVATLRAHADDPAVAAALASDDRARDQAEQVERLRAALAGVAVLTLPRLPDARLGLEAYRTLGEEIGRHLV
jgi:anion-transporting  ArsA/GET3 family ATPase